MSSCRNAPTIINVMSYNDPDQLDGVVRFELRHFQGLFVALDHILSKNVVAKLYFFTLTDFY